MDTHVYAELFTTARSRRTLHYADLSAPIGLDTRRAEDRTAISEMLREISTHEHRGGRPLTSAIVVLSETGLPGDGFFTLVEGLGYAVVDRVAFHAEERERAWDEWSR